MLKLSKENFIKARDFVFANSDDINRAWFRYNFEDGDGDKFMDALGQYQYDNGGFGGNYYEFAYKGPCLKCTEIAISYILNLKEKPSAAHPVIQKMMKYILGCYIPGIGNWGEPVVPEVNDEPHIHHVRYRGIDVSPIASEDERIEKYDANEKVCFAAFVAYYSELVPDDLYAEIVKYPSEYILRYWDENSPLYNKRIFEDGSPYDFEYFQWFVPHLKDKALSDKLAAILRQNPTAFMELDYAKSDNDYVHLPCDSVMSPSSVVYPAVKDIVADSLDHRMSQQCDNGGWALGWGFGGGDDKRKLHTAYEAFYTMGILAKLGRFGRIEL